MTLLECPNGDLSCLRQFDMLLSLEDRSYLATKVGRLLRGGAGGLTTPLWGDEYYTPEYAFRLLVPYLPKQRCVWEGCWGTGELACHMRKAGYRVVGKC